MSRTMLDADEPPVLLAGGATTRADVAPWAHHDRGRLLAHRQPVVDALLERLRGLSLRELRTAAPAALRELTLSFCGRDTLASLDSLLDGCAHLPEPARLRATASIARTVELVGRDVPGLSAAMHELRELVLVSALFPPVCLHCAGVGLQRGCPNCGRHSAPAERAWEWDAGLPTEEAWEKVAWEKVVAREGAEVEVPLVVCDDDCSDPEHGHDARTEGGAA